MCLQEKVWQVACVWAKKKNCTWTHRKHYSQQPAMTNVPPNKLIRVVLLLFDGSLGGYESYKLWYRAVLSKFRWWWPCENIYVFECWVQPPAPFIFIITIITSLSLFARLISKSNSHRLVPPPDKTCWIGWKVADNRLRMLALAI